MLKEYGDWMPLGSTDEGKPPQDGTVKLQHSDDNPVGGWYGLRKGYRGRFANYIPPLMDGGIGTRHDRMERSVGQLAGWLRFPTNRTRPPQCFYIPPLSTRRKRRPRCLNGGLSPFLMREAGYRLAPGVL